MSDAIPEPVKKVTAADFDFASAATFRDLHRIAVGNVQVATKTTSLMTVGEGAAATRGDYWITIAPGKRRHVAKNDFEQLYEIDPEDSAFYRSRNVGKAVWIREHVIFIEENGTEIPVDAGGAIFKSDINGAAKPYKSKDFTDDFGRLLKNQELIRLSVSVIAQYKAIMQADDSEHLKDIGGQPAKFLTDKGIEIGSAMFGTASAVVKDAGGRLVSRLEAKNPQLVQRGRDAVTRARGWLGSLRGGGEPPGTKPGG